LNHDLRQSKGSLSYRGTVLTQRDDQAGIIYRQIDIHTNIFHAACRCSAVRIGQGIVCDLEFPCAAGRKNNHEIITSSDGDRGVGISGLQRGLDVSGTIIVIQRRRLYPITVTEFECASGRLIEE